MNHAAIPNLIRSGKRSVKESMQLPHDASYFLAHPVMTYMDLKFPILFIDLRFDLHPHPTLSFTQGICVFMILVSILLGLTP